MSPAWQRWAEHGQSPALRHRVALIYGQQSLTFGEMFSLVERVPPPGPDGHPALLPGPPEPWTVLALLVFLRAGQTLVPVAVENLPLLPVYRRLIPSAPVLGVTAAGEFRVESFGSAAAAALPPALGKLPPAHAGLVLFTSGTTGEAKGVLHDLEKFFQSYSLKVADNQPTLLLLGTDHVGGVDVLLRAWARGSTVVLTGGDRSPAHLAQIVERHRVQVLPATPSLLNLLLLSGVVESHDLSSLKIVPYGAERMPPALLQRLRQRFPHVSFLQKFGTTETGGIAVADAPGGELFLQAAPEAVRIEAGELWVRAPQSLLGYIGGAAEDAARLTADGWFRTGDRVEVAADGSFRIIGRATEMVKIGGEQIAPGEVENCILQLAAVAACRVEAVPNAILGQVLVAKIQPVDPEVSPESLTRTIRTHCRQHLPAPFVPVKTLPLPPLSSRLKQV